MLTPTQTVCCVVWNPGWRQHGVCTRLCAITRFTQRWNAEGNHTTHNWRCHAVNPECAITNRISSSVFSTYTNGLNTHSTTAHYGDEHFKCNSPGSRSSADAIYCWQRLREVFRVSPHQGLAKLLFSSMSFHKRKPTIMMSFGDNNNSNNNGNHHHRHHHS